MHTAESILVVEDDLSTLMLIKSVLGKQGYRLLEAADGQEGLEVFQRERPDLVLMDVMMPRLDGFAACVAMREFEALPGTPVIMLTAADATADVERAFESGATDFITKPINWPLLAARLRYTLRARRTSLELQRTRLRQSHAQKIARVGFWAWHADSDRLEWSQDLAEMAGVSAEQIDHLDKLLTQVHPDDRARLARAMNVTRTTMSRLDQEVRLPQAGGGMRVLHLVAELSSTQGAARLFEGAWQDVTQTREAERMVQHLAWHDTLTGLPNRKLFLHLLEAAIEHARREGRGIAMVLFDISRLGRINDALGMNIGDLVLARVAHVLQQGLPSGIHVARLAGDEFALLVPHNDLSRVRTETDAALARAGQPIDIDGQVLFVTLTAGIALFPDHAGHAEEMIQAARGARKLARLQGMPLSIARPASADRATELKLELALRAALEEDFRQFHLVYQPQLQLRDNRIVGVEALIRWEHPEVGLVPPPHFIPIMEELGLINALGEWILRSTCRQLRAWQNAGVDLLMSINLSPRQFQDSRLSEVLAAAVRDADVQPAQIKLEITETIAMQDPQGTIEQLRGWRAQGFQIAIDDFGIGYSSLEYLLRFPLDTIKIDRAFIKNIVTSPSDRAIVRAVSVMAQSMGLTTVAEGVETQRQQDYLDALGVTQIQGYLLGRPMRADDLVRFYRAHQGVPSAICAAAQLEAQEL